MNRGEKEKILNVKIDVDKTKLSEEIKKIEIKDTNELSQIVILAIEDARKTDFRCGSSVSHRL